MSLRLDLHIHSRYSPDSYLEPKEIVDLAKKRGFNGIAITDHVSAKGGLEAFRLNQDPDFAVIPGIEYATEIGHVLGLFIQEDPRVPPAPATKQGFGSHGERPLAEVVKAIHAQGGLAVLAHPFEAMTELPRPWDKHPERLFRHIGPNPKEAGQNIAILDALEAHNARAGTRQNPYANKQAKAFAEKLRIPVTGGSDAHMPFEIGRGGCVIHALGPGASLAEIKAAILEGKATSFGIESPRAVVPMTLLLKMRKSRRYADAPKILAQLALACLGKPGLWLESALRKAKDK